MRQSRLRVPSNRCKILTPACGQMPSSEAWPNEEVDEACLCIPSRAVPPEQCQAYLHQLSWGLDENTSSWAPRRQYGHSIFRVRHGVDRNTSLLVSSRNFKNAARTVCLHKFNPAAAPAFATQVKSLKAMGLAGSIRGRACAGKLAVSSHAIAGANSSGLLLYVKVITSTRIWY